MYLAICDSKIIQGRALVKALRSWVFCSKKHRRDVASSRPSCCRRRWFELGLPATQTINMQRQETTARTTQPGSQNTTSTQQRKITVSTSVANGLGTHVFQVELGHDVAAIDTQTNKHVTIDKGTLVSIFQQERLFHPFFILVHVWGCNIPDTTNRS